MPDWRKQEDYSFTEGLSNYRWAWEFLRRNPDYKKDWEQALRLYLKFCADHGKQAAGERLCYGEQVEPSDHRFSIGDSRLRPEMLEKWGTVGFVNPEQDNPERLCFKPKARYPFSHRGPTVEAEAEGVDLRLRLEAYQVAIVYDVRFPLEDQVKNSRLHLRQHLSYFTKALGGKVFPRPHRMPVEWRRYLRLLDGREAGATYKQLAETILGTQAKNADPFKTIDDLLQQAKEMLKPERYLKII